ncbi:hypothetical protein B7463_g1613, partial [Scytalidium lignicola]
MESSSGFPPLKPRNELPRPQQEERFRIARKPIQGGLTREPSPNPHYERSNRTVMDSRNVSVERMKNLNLKDEPSASPAIPKLPPRPRERMDIDIPESITGLRPQLSPRPITASSSRSTTFGSTSTASFPLNNASTNSTTDSSKSSASSFALSAYQEARHFAGGLIAHPFESTKDYSILRHSHGLVFYKGTSTNIAISIFATNRLPADRAIWLQSKGWTGKIGMRTKALFGAHDDWLNVTPAMNVGVEQLKPTNERAWQRDISRFRKKAVGHKRERHILRETAVVCIPGEAGDGYFQLVLCTGEKKKVLCRSPVFRVISTSRDPSSVRGASLSTLPLELGAMAFSTYAQSTVGTVLSPVTEAVQNQVDRYMPSWWKVQAATTAYDVSGAADRVDSTLDVFQQRYDQALDGTFMQAAEVELVIDQGPMPPYPFRFMIRGDLTRDETNPSSLPFIHLTKIPEDANRKLRGYYYGWVRVEKGEKKVTASDTDSWYQVIISVLSLDASQLAYASVTAASKKYLTLQLIQELEDIPFGLNEFEVQLMGFIRPDEPSQRAALAKGLQAGDQAAAEAALLAEMSDIAMAQSVLDHPAWSPMVVTQSRSIEGKQGLLQRIGSGYAETRLKVQKQVDRVPLHKLGVRLPIDEMEDKGLIPNGYYVVR